VWQHDVVIHGVRVRATTNSPHLIHFWRENWYSVDEWQGITGRPAPETPQVVVYAFGGVADQQEAAYYSRRTNTIIFFNTSYYGQLKSWVLGAVGRVLAEEYGIHSIHGACVEKDGQGILYIAPTGTGKSTSSYGLMSYATTRFHSDDWVYIRYVHTTRDGRLVHPTTINVDGQTIRGFRCFRWLDRYRDRRGGILSGLTLDNELVTIRVADINFAEPRRAYAYTSEKIFYLRTNLVENFPEAIPEMLRSHLENVPDVTPAFTERYGALANRLADTLMRSSSGKVHHYVAEWSREEIVTQLQRLFAFDNARAMLDITRILPRERVFINPLEPVHITSVFLIKRTFDDPVVIERLRLDRFMERLLIGETPDGKREIAYNAYRAVDDTAERVCVDRLERVAKEKGLSLYQAFRRDNSIPETLYEEFELFRVMFQACACYDLNTIIQSDPTVGDKMEAVERTIALIARVVEMQPRRLSRTVRTYSTLLRQPRSRVAIGS
jgi:hypothetical protein